MRRVLKWGAVLCAMTGAAPAYATGGYTCSTTDGSRIEFYATVGRSNAPSVPGVIMIVDGKETSTTDAALNIEVGQSWIDSKYAMIEVVKKEDSSTYAKLVTRLDKDGKGKGTLDFLGKAHPVECEIE